jgi:hypothetical protein
MSEDKKPNYALTVNRDVLDALLLARRVLRRWTELYAEWSQANGHMEALFDRRLPPADHIKAQEAVQAALNSTCEEALGPKAAPMPTSTEKR